MSKLNKYLKLQLATELKKDAKDCIKIKNKLQDIDNAVWSSKWRILVDVKFKGFPSDERTYKPSKLGYIFLKGIKDNPVPSLEKVKEILFSKKRWYDNYQDAENGIEECYRLLQNGVETNKREPIYEEDDYLG